MLFLLGISRYRVPFHGFDRHAPRSPNVTNPLLEASSDDAALHYRIPYCGITINLLRIAIVVQVHFHSPTYIISHKFPLLMVRMNPIKIPHDSPLNPIVMIYE